MSVNSKRCRIHQKKMFSVILKVKSSICRICAISLTEPINYCVFKRNILLLTAAIHYIASCCIRLPFLAVSNVQFLSSSTSPYLFFRTSVFDLLIPQTSPSFSRFWWLFPSPRSQGLCYCAHSLLKVSLLEILTTTGHSVLVSHPSHRRYDLHCSFSCWYGHSIEL